MRGQGSGSNFPALTSFLDLNREQGQEMGNTINQGLTAQSDMAVRQGQGVQNAFLKPAEEWSKTAGDTIGLSTTYGGNKDFTKTAGYDSANTSLTNAANAWQATGTEAGKGSLLTQQYGAPVSMFDTALLGNNFAPQAQGQFTALSGWLGGAQKAGEGQIAGYEDAAKVKEAKKKAAWSEKNNKRNHQVGEDYYAQKAKEAADAEAKAAAEAAAAAAEKARRAKAEADRRRPIVNGFGFGGYNGPGLGF